MLSLEVKRRDCWFTLNKRSLKKGPMALVELCELWDRWSISDRFRGCEFRITVEALPC